MGNEPALDLYKLSNMGLDIPERKRSWGFHLAARM